MRKKVTPRRLPASQADVARAKKEATEAAVKLAWSILFTVLRDVLKQEVGADIV